MNNINQSGPSAFDRSLLPSESSISNESEHFKINMEEIPSVEQRVAALIKPTVFVFSNDYKQDENGCTALHRIATKDPYDVELLIEAIPEKERANIIKIQDKRGNTSLHLAAANFTTLKLLIEAISGTERADIIRIQNKDGNNPLHLVPKTLQFQQLLIDAMLADKQGYILIQDVLKVIPLTFLSTKSFLLCLFHFHNRTLLSLMKDGESKYLSSVAEKEKKKFFSWIALYWENPEKLKEQLVQHFPHKQDKLTEGFTKLENLRSWITQEYKNEGFTECDYGNFNLYHSRYVEAMLRERITELQTALLETPVEKLLVCEVECGKDLELRGKKRLNIELQIPINMYLSYFKAYFLAYAIHPEEGEKWQKDLLEKLSDTLSTKIPQGHNLTEKELSQLKDACMHGKTWQAESCDRPVRGINFKSAWFSEIEQDRYAVANEKKNRLLEIWADFFS